MDPVSIPRHMQLWAGKRTHIAAVDNVYITILPLMAAAACYT